MKCEKCGSSDTVKTKYGALYQCKACGQKFRPSTPVPGGKK